jgi:hypothetical protein
MKMHTLIENKYDEQKHRYEVTIGTNMGYFTGAVTCREEDYAHENTNVGYDLAEMKATMKYAQAKRKVYTERAKALKHFLSNMSSTRTFDTTAYWVKQCRKEIDRLWREASEWRQFEERLKQGYRLKIESRDQYFKRREG